MSGDLKNPSKAIPVGTLWAMLSTLLAYLLVIFSLASSTAHSSFVHNTNVIQETNIWPPIIFAGEFATTFFSALMGLIGSAKLMQALARDRLFPGLSVFGMGTKRADEPVLAICFTCMFFIPPFLGAFVARVSLVLCEMIGSPIFERLFGSGRNPEMQEKGVSTSLLTAAIDIIAQFAMFANLNQIATLISMGYQVSPPYSKTRLVVGAGLDL
jgi:amino acid transporter